MSSTGVEMKVDIKEGHGYDFDKLFVVLTKFGSCFCLNF